MSKQPLNGPRRWRRRLAGHGREAASSGAACPPRRWRGVLVRGAAMEATRSAADWHRLGCAAFEAGSRGGEARLLGQQTGVLGISDGWLPTAPSASLATPRLAASSAYPSRRTRPAGSCAAARRVGACRRDRGGALPRDLHQRSRVVARRLERERARSKWGRALSVIWYLSNIPSASTPVLPLTIEEHGSHRRSKIIKC